MTKKKSSLPSDGRTRNWCAVVYPESAPENWKEILDDLHLRWVESPLHDCDTNPTGEVKKAHWHILLLFEGKKSQEQVAEMLAPLNCPLPQIVHEVRGNVRYMAHLDNPEKFQYSVSDIIGHGGADLADLLKPTASERHEIIRQMITWCKDNKIVEFQDLMDYAMDCEPSWFDALSDSCVIVMQAYLKSARHRDKSSAGSEHTAAIPKR